MSVAQTNTSSMPNRSTKTTKNCSLDSKPKWVQSEGLVPYFDRHFRAEGFSVKTVIKIFWMTGTRKAYACKF